MSLPIKEARKLFPDIGKGLALLKFQDELGKSYDIQYIYYATKNSYGLGTGLSKFLSARGLKAGDFVYLGEMKNDAYQISIAPIVQHPVQIAGEAERIATEELAAEAERITADPEKIATEGERIMTEALVAEAERFAMEVLLQLRKSEEEKTHKHAHHPEEEIRLRQEDLQIQVYKPPEEEKAHQILLNPNRLQVYKPPLNLIPTGASLSLYDLDVAQKVEDKVVQKVRKDLRHRERKSL